MATITISGSDSNLGTITSNISYSVTTDSGNPISLTRVVNSVQVASQTVTSGFNYSIPIADLPTGTNTVQIVATTSTTSGNISATRTWTYYKTPINIPSTGGIAQLTQNGQNIWPVTVPDAVEAPVYLGGNLNTALNKLGQAALYTAPGKPLYNQVTIDLSTVSVGDEINLPYNGVMTPHIVVQIGNPDSDLYDSSCDGVWLLMKDCIAQGAWNSTASNLFLSSTIINSMENYLSNYDETLSSQIKTVKIPYCIGGGSNTVYSGSNGYSTKIFLLSYYELTSQVVQYYPKDGITLDYFSNNNKDIRIANYNNSPVQWWTRSPYTHNSTHAGSIENTGVVAAQNCTNNYAIRPCFIIPTTFTASYYVDSYNNVHSSQQYTLGGSITDIFGYNIPISQFEVGQYTGTGTYGASNPTSITTTSMPKFVCITNTTNPYIRAILPYGGYGFMFNANTTTSTAISAYGLNATWSDTGVSWYNTSANTYQMNQSGVTYQYVIFS